MYTIETADGGPDLRIESTLSKIEGRFAQIRTNKLNNLQELTPEEHAYLRIFLAAAQFRTAASRDHHAEQWRNVLRVADDLEGKMAKATID